MNSRNHFAFGTVAEWMQRYLAGIDTDPDLLGGKTMLIRPRIGGGLTHVRGEYDGLYGTLISDWTREGDQLTMKVTVPANTLARVFVPWTATAGAITEGGKTVWESGAYVSGHPGILGAAVKRGNVVALEDGGGSYEFRVKYPAVN
jgi:alpha-L-rhamnosidase